jgi:hypothetical protein
MTAEEADELIYAAEFAEHNYSEIPTLVGTLERLREVARPDNGLHFLGWPTPINP